jgi:spore germination protein GerM
MMRRRPPLRFGRLLLAPLDHRCSRGPAAHRQAERRRWTIRVASVACLVALLAACGIPSDGRPRDIAADERLQLSDTKAPEQAAATTNGPKVYFLSQGPKDEDRLQPAGRDVVSTPSAVLTELFNGLTATEQQTNKWRTAVPPDTKLVDAPVQQPDGTLVVNLNQAFFQASGPAQINAVAQVVFTATGLDGVQRVKILVEGQPQGWPRGDGTAQLVGEPLSQYAYPELNPDSQPDYPPAPSPTPSTTAPPPPTTTPATTLSPLPAPSLPKS